MVLKKPTHTRTDPYPDVTQYQSLIGGLQYLTVTRPEISFSANHVCQFMEEPTVENFQVVKRVCRYLQGTLTHGVQNFKKGSMDRITYYDAN